ncbi:peptidase [Bacteroidia bacterium]|nr:peptidase [Bacteroidia bacterium]
MKISQIRKKIFLARDGVSADSLRKKGIHYKMIYGVPVVTLRKIARDYAPDYELANILWKEDNRELKILATLIQEPELFETANEWVSDIHNLELAEQSVMNLFCKLSDASHLAKDWIQSKEPYIVICGFLLYTRLFSQNTPIKSEEAELYFESVEKTLRSDSQLLRNAALTSLKRLGRQSVLQSKDILTRFSSNPFYEELKFEFEFFSKYED